jgi:hypothetical protein
VRALLILIAVGCLPVGARALDATLRVSPGASCVSAQALTAPIDAWLAGAPAGSGMTIEVTGDPEDPRARVRARRA